MDNKDIAAKINFLFNEIIDDSISLISSTEIDIDSGATDTPVKLKIEYITDEGDVVEPCKEASSMLIISQIGNENLIYLSDIGTTIPALIKALEMIQEEHLKIDNQLYEDDDNEE